MIKEQAEEIRKKIKEMLRDKSKDTKNYTEALPLCKQLWEIFDETNNLWDAWQYIFCLYNLGKLDEAESISEKLLKTFSDKDIPDKKAYSYFTNCYSRIINDKYFRTIDKNIQNEEIHKLLDKAIFIGKLVKHEEKSPLEFCSFRALTTAKKHLSIFPSEKVLTILSKLDPKKLSQKTYSILLDNGKTVENQSYQEAYYSYKTRALLNLKRYNECLDCCNEAFTTVEKFHFSNDVWIENRLLNCIANLGNLKEAIKRAEKLILQKDSWFLLYQLAKLYIKDNRKSEALTFMLRAAYTRGPLEMKVQLIEDIGDLYKAENEIEFAQQHYMLAKQVREKNGWKVSNSLQQKISSGTIIDEKKIRRQWLNEIYNRLGRQNGIITRLNGRTGFVSYTGGSLFFSTKNFIGKAENLKEKSKVVFVVTKSFNQRKQEESSEANYITIDYENKNFSK